MQKKLIVEKKLGIPPDYQYKALRSKNFIHSNWHQNKLEILNHLLNFNKTSRVLDLGIGSGNFEFLYHDKVKEIVGIDYNDEAIMFVRKWMKKEKVTNVKAKLGNIKNLKIKNIGKFDFIILVDVIEHFKIKEVKKFLETFKNILKSNGKICIITPNFQSTWVLIEYLLDKLKLAPEMGGKQHLSKFNRKLLVEILNESGFKVEKIVTFNTLSFIVPITELRKKINKWETKKLKYGNLIALVASV